jgi:hypothetical protein
MGSLIGSEDVRSFFNPPLSYDDVTTAEIDLKIEAVESYIEQVYELTSSADARIPALLLVASKLAQNPKFANKYFTLSSETLRDYSYSLGGNLGGAGSQYTLSRTWEQMAIEMLSAKSYTKDNKLKIYISNS